MKVKYIIKYKKGQRSKQVIGFIRIPKDLPEGFTSDELTEFVIAKHNLQDAHPLEIQLKNYINKNIKYDNTISKPSGVDNTKDTGSRK